MKMHCQCMIGVGLVQLAEDWHRFRTVRVPPLNIFRGSSRPIRGQDFGLSANKKPRFRPDSELLTNLKPSNALPLCHWNATLTNEKPMDSITCQFIPMDCESPNSLPLCQWNATGSFSMPLQFTGFMGPRLYSRASSQDPLIGRLPL